MRPDPRLQLIVGALGAIVGLALLGLVCLASLTLAAILTAPPGHLQIVATLLAAFALRPAPPVPVAVEVIDHDDALLWGLLLRTEVPR